MFSNLASFIFGNAPGDEAPPPNEQQPLILSSSSRPRPPQSTLVDSREEKSEEDDDWVLVGGAGAPTLGSLNEAMPRPIVTGSTGSSASPSEDGENADEMASAAEEAPSPHPHRMVPLSRSARRLTSPFSCQTATLPQLKAMRAAQTAGQRKAAKEITAKAVERRNKAVKIQGSKKANRDNLAIKASGCNKQLKQC